MINWFLELFNFTPVRASSWAAQVDWLNNLITAISVVCIVGITGVMLFFAWKYRKKSSTQKTSYITHNATVETIWTVIPSIICAFMFVFGYNIYHEMRNPPAGAMEVSVVGKKWSWNFQYAGGKKTTNELVVPVGQAVKLIMTSNDVIHSLFIPAMRVKEDVYNGNYSYLWFTPTIEGEFPIYCTEYCGTSHSDMKAKLRVVSRAEYDDFLSDRLAANAVEKTPAERGEVLYQNNCKVCHTIDGSRLVGPSLKGMFSGKKHEMLDGTLVDVDENYIQESIKNPNAKVVKGYPPAMTPFPDLAAEEVSDIIAYLKTL